MAICSIARWIGLSHLEISEHCRERLSEPLLYPSKLCLGFAFLFSAGLRAKKLTKAPESFHLIAIGISLVKLEGGRSFPFKRQ